MLQCLPLVQPGSLAETCNHEDDDCHGVRDNGFGVDSSCNAGVGACAVAGGVTCGGVGGAVCDAVPGEPQAASFDNVDNDCDTGLLSKCAAGITACHEGGSLECVQLVPSRVDVCDGLDDD